MSAITKEQFVEFIKGLTLIEAADLVKELEGIFGVSAVAPVAAAAGACLRITCLFPALSTVAPARRRSVALCPQVDFSIQ